MPLSQEQLDFFWANGYLNYGKLFTDEEVEAFRAEYDEVFRQAVEGNAFRNIAIDDGGDSQHKLKAPKQMLQITQMCERSIRFRKLLYEPRILDLVQDLIGPNLMLFHDQALSKPARTGGAVSWHQDNGYWRCRPANLVSCWMTFDDAVKENGAMQVIPGSHLKPVWHERSAETNALLKIEAVDDSKAVVCDVPAGGIMFHHCQTLHYTQPNETDRPRRAFAIHFMPPGTRDRKGETMRVDFKHPLLRASV
ncbi:MAG: phytanoyl-CoA dioxygenase family protein [Planctomycetota bacterium]|nr:phytanoyl-CoA dioxygenase family protein [Planctomycetota bacterium]